MGDDNSIYRNNLLQFFDILYLSRNLHIHLRYAIRQESVMGHRFAEIAFTDKVKELQEAYRSRGSYARMEGGEPTNNVMSAAEADFIAARDSFYMATVSETGWPYVQHRGGPAGFVKVLDPTTLGFADFRGNRQYVSVGNLQSDNRVSLFFMDYPNRRRLKMLGRTRIISEDDKETLDKLVVPDYRAAVERGMLIEIEAFDWNCPQHITPRYTEDDVAAANAGLLDRIAELEAQLSAQS
jgi:predicted pyridoxine 5'-phosphate oxidase superfamily flavin-nucleotide-binding protein